MSLPTEVQSLGCGPAAGFSIRIPWLQLTRQAGKVLSQLGGQEDPRSVHVCKESCFTCLDAAGDAQGKTGGRGTTLKRTEGGFFLFLKRKGNYSVTLLYEMLLWVANAGI